MKAFDVVGLLPTLIEIVRDRVVGYDEQIMKRFDHAIAKSLKPTAKYDDLYIKNAMLHESELIGLLVQSYDNPAGIEDIELPSCINKEEFRRLCNQTQKDKELVNVLKDEWNYYISKDINNRVKAIQAEIVILTNEIKKVGEGVGEVKEDTGEIKKDLGELKEDVDKGFNKIIERIDKKDDKNGCNNENRNRILVVLTDSPHKADTTNVIGREKDLENLWALVKKPESHVILNGFGGVGKTKLAQMLFHTYEREFDEVAWIKYHENLRTSFLTCITDENLQSDGGEEKRWGFMKNILINDGKKKLFVIDNVDGEGDKRHSNYLFLKDLTGLKGMSVLLTSRRTMDLDDFETFDLGYLSKDDCIRLFNKYYKGKNPNRETVINLVKLAGFHTLTIELLAKGARQKKDLEQYYQKVKNGFENDDAKISANNNEELTIERHLRCLFDIQSRKKREKEVLYGFAILPINCECEENEMKDWFGFKRDDWDNLYRDGWLRVDGNMKCSMHPLVRTIIRFDFKEDESNRNNLAFKGVADKIILYIESHAELYQIEKDWNYSNVKRMVGIAESVIELAVHEEDEQHAELYYNIGFGYKEMGEYDNARKYFDKALNIREGVLKKVLEKLLPTYSNIGRVYSYQGDLEEALKYYRKALELKMKMSNAQESKLAIADSFSDIGGVYRQRNSVSKNDCDLDNALKLHFKALEIRKKYRPNSHETAISNNNIGTVYHAKGRDHYKEALDFYEEAIKIEEEHPNDGHRFKAELFNHIAELYLERQNYDIAKGYYEKVYGINKELFGENHPYTEKASITIRELANKHYI